MPINSNEELTPETSQEAFTARTYDPMQPVPEEAETNMEAYIKYLYDKTQRLPEKPDTREEYFMMIAGQNIEPGSDVEPLTVTENGTYSETGKAYSPVTVNVPLPTNANEHKSVTSYPVTDSANYPLPKCDVTVTDADKCEVIVTTDNTITEDSGVYIERQSGGGNRELDAIVGGSIVWNQLVPSSASSSSSVTNNGDGTYTIAIGSNEYYELGLTNVTSGHKYYAILKGGEDGKCYLRIDDEQGNPSLVTVSPTIWVPNFTSSNRRIFIRTLSTTVVYTVIPQLIDLTATFGSTIADYVYTLEQSTAGSGIAWLKSYGYLTEDYYGYTANKIESVSVARHKTVGFNQWDEQWELGGLNNTTGQKFPLNTAIRCKNYILCKPNTNYYYYCGVSELEFRICYYDKSKNFISCEAVVSINNTYQTPFDCYYIMFSMRDTYGTTYNHDICINISNPSKNGTYEPYEEHTYPINPITLRGIPKLNASNQLYYDGDIYEASGRVTRKYGVRAYQSGDESLTDAITDGTNTVYKLTTPTYEDSSPFEANQIVDANGTEEYIEAGVEAGTRDVAIPVGHDTKYYNGKAYVKPLTAGTSDTVSMADMGIMPTSPMYIEANGTLDVEYWKSNS